MSEGPLAARVLLVDDHPMVREGLRCMLTGDAGIQVVGEAGTAGEALRLFEELAPDVVLLDLELPDEDGIRTLARLKQVRPGTAVLMVTMHDDPSRVRAALAAGAAGYVLKGVGRGELLASVRAVQRGAVVLDPALARSALAGPAPDDAAEPLSAVERDVLQHIAAGLTNAEIAGRMRWSVATAKKYVQRVLARLGTSDRTQAAVAAMRRGLLE